MNINLFIVGDEILSGKRSDKHLPRVIELLATRGLELSGIEVLPDDEKRIAESIVRVRQRGEILLSCGGIGATPDDCTRQAAARAFDVPIERHAEGARLLINEYGDRVFPKRILMVDFPLGAQLIPNPVNRVPGFFVERCYFVPGFPEMAWPMLEWVLETQLADLHNAEPAIEYRLRVIGTNGEGDLVDLMEAVLSDYPGVKLSSLPSRGTGVLPRHIEFGIKGPPRLAEPAVNWFRAQLLARGDAHVEDLDPR